MSSSDLTQRLDNLTIYLSKSTEDLPLGAASPDFLPPLQSAVTWVAGLPPLADGRSPAEHLSLECSTRVTSQSISSLRYTISLPWYGLGERWRERALEFSSILGVPRAAQPWLEKMLTERERPSAVILGVSEALGSERQSHRIYLEYRNPDDSASSAPSTNPLKMLSLEWDSNTNPTLKVRRYQEVRLPPPHLCSPWLEGTLGHMPPPELLKVAEQLCIDSEVPFVYLRTDSARTLPSGSAGSRTLHFSLGRRPLTSLCSFGAILAPIFPTITTSPFSALSQREDGALRVLGLGHNEHGQWHTTFYHAPLEAHPSPHQRPGSVCMHVAAKKGEAGPTRITALFGADPEGKAAVSLGELQIFVGPGAPLPHCVPQTIANTLNRAQSLACPLPRFLQTHLTEINVRLAHHGYHIVSLAKE